MNQPKSIICPVCAEPASDCKGEIICGNPSCEVYPPIISDKSTSLEVKVCALLASGAKTIEEMAERLGLERLQISNTVYGLKGKNSVQSEWDGEADAFRWVLTDYRRIETLSREQKEKLILEAIRAGNHLPRTIARVAKLTESETVCLLGKMEGISRKNETNFSAYFVTSEVPAGRLILNGEGGVTEIGIDVRTDVSAVVRAQKEMEIELRNQKILEEKKQMEAIAKINGETQIAKEKLPPAVSNRGRPRTGIKYTAEMFEELGKKGLNKTEIANELQVTLTAILYQLKKDDLRLAYERGLNSRPVDKRLVKKGKSHKLGWTAQIFEQLAEQYFEVKLVAEAMNCSYHSITRQLQKHPAFLEAWFRGQQKFLAKHPDYKPNVNSLYFKAQKLGLNLETNITETAPQDSPIAVTSEPIVYKGTIVSDARLANTLEHFKTKDTETAALAERFNSIYETVELEPVISKPAQFKTIQLGSAGTLELKLDINLLEADAETRTWLNHFINQIQGFEKGKTGNSA